MRPVWLNSYPPGVKSEIDLKEFTSVPSILDFASRRFGSLPAFRSFGIVNSFADLETSSRHFAAALQQLPGLKRNARVALMLPNILQYPVALFGVLRAGMTVVNVNPLYTSREIVQQLSDAGADAIVLLENFAHTLQKALPSTPSVRHVIITAAGDMANVPRRWAMNFAIRHVKHSVPQWSIPHALSFRSLLRTGERSAVPMVAPEPSDIAFLQYTGGTTGRARAAVLTHENVVANVLQATEWARTVLGEGSEVAITALPMYHIFSLTVCCLLFVRLGALQILIANPRDMRAFVGELRRTPFTAIAGVNTLYSGLLNTPGFKSIDFSALKFAIGGGAAIQQSVAERWEQVTGRPLVQGYGLTEASPLVTCNPLTSCFSGSVGLPMPSTEVSIRDDAGAELAADHAGEIWVRGPQVMKMYWGQPEETSGAITSDGWLRTGDIGVMDAQGYLRITDRKKDLILVSGFNVYPNEVEEVISSMPGVAECAVVGAPDPITGEAVQAFIVSSGGALTAQAITAYCRERLTNYKVPRKIEFRTELPHNAIGKILRREMRAATHASAGEAGKTVASRGPDR